MRDDSRDMAARLVGLCEIAWRQTHQIVGVGREQQRRLEEAARYFAAAQVQLAAYVELRQASGGIDLAHPPE